ncbi:MAG TPA: hypothetical protein DD979_05145 [Gammaproteobacteria bacterium]|nr:hypothetical protein [Gammaproteobacteria bacterium]
MNLYVRGILLVSVMASTAVFAEAYTSRYAGEEQRTIKSLSADDIATLERGGGWGLAKAAELNGVPGPLHILQMADEIRLTSPQHGKIAALYDKMKTQAIPLGKALIRLEVSLNAQFSDGTLSAGTLQQLLQEIEAVRADLRYVHLAAHLETPAILTPEQIRHYNQLRGYGNDPCQHVPKGHNPEMWKRHHGCG